MKKQSDFKKLFGYVYFIEYNNMIKIGRSNNYLRRIREFSTTMPLQEMIIWAIIPTKDMYETELYYQDRYSSFRIFSNKEWYTKDILRYRGIEW